MAMRRLFIVALSMALIHYVMPREARADGVRGTAAEDREYGQRQASSAGLEEFSGGSALGVVVAILVIAALVVLIWYLVEHHHGHAYRGGPGKGAPEPAAGYAFGRAP
jgi:hypothetical protein